MGTDLGDELERQIPDGAVPRIPIEPIKRRGRQLLWRRRIGLGTVGLLSLSVFLIGMVIIDGESKQAQPIGGAGESAAEEPSPSPSTNDEDPLLINDGVVSVHPKIVAPGDNVKLVVKGPPGTYGLAWFVDRRDGSKWVYVGGFRAGPKGQWEKDQENRFYFLPKWKSIGIEDAGFQGPSSTFVQLPPLDPGTYRVVNEFAVNGSGESRTEWHYGMFEVRE